MRARLITEITVDEFLEAEDGADLRHEYVYGEVFALAGGSVSTGYYREAAGWQERRFGLEDAIPVPCVEILSFNELYDKTLL